MAKIYISAGHSPKQPGASGNGYKEELLTIELRDLIVAELKLLGVNPIIDSNENALTHSIAFFKNLVGSESIVLDIHFNASAIPTAKGTETLIPKDYNLFEYELATDLSHVMSYVLGTPKRGTNGVKTELESHHGSLGWMRLKGNNVLLEVCFISNPIEMNEYEAKKEVLAKGLASVLFSHSKKKQ
jgi:N-acetylmuramoyl-L-alanine amidase